jgi:myo-inositol-1(or 4)-monophosphatase
LRESLLVTGFHPKVINSLDDNLDHFCRLMKLCQAVRRPGSAAMDLVYTAMGRFEGFWELKLCPWDVAAGALIATEAGATLSKFDGTPATIYDEEILVSNGLVHQEMVDALQSSKD